MADSLEAIVRGRVQGVGFRYFAHREATVLGLTGWVANESDGSVRCVAAGDRLRLEAFLDRLRTGPPAAVVDRVDVTWRPSVDDVVQQSFSIRSGSHRGD